MSKSVGRPKGSKKTRKNNRDLEEEEDLDLEEEELDDLDLDDVSDEDLYDLSDDLDEAVRKRREPSISKEINKMINNTIKDIKDGDMAVPAIGLGLVAIIGFAIYKGAKL
jgi:hypothetical protein